MLSNLPGSDANECAGSTSPAFCTAESASVSFPSLWYAKFNCHHAWEFFGSSLVACSSLAAASANLPALYSALPSLNESATQLIEININNDVESTHPNPLRTSILLGSCD